MRFAGGGKAGLDIVVEAIGDPRQRHAVDVPFVGSRVTRFSGSGGCSTSEASRIWREAWSRARCRAPRPRKPCMRKIGAVRDRRARRPGPAVIADLDAERAASFRKSPSRRFSMPEVESGPR